MEPPTSTNSVRRISSREAARWLTAPQAVELLRPFLGRSASVSEAAAILGMSVKDAHYRVRRMFDLGIVEVVAEERRAGRAVKRYSTCCDAFFVPFALTPAATLAERVLEQTGPALEAIGASMVRGLEEDHMASRLGFALRAAVPHQPDGDLAGLGICAFLRGNGGDGGGPIRVSRRGHRAVGAASMRGRAGRWGEEYPRG